MRKKWVVKKNLSGQFEGDSQIPDFLKNILANRNIKTLEETEKFFNPNYEKGIYGPFLILNMRGAAERVISALKNKEKIVIFGDYDADGICGAAIFRSFLKKINYENFEIYIPDRNKEEHGLSAKLIEEFADKKIDLIITIDCGITEYEEVKMANEKGIDTVITDHHIPPEKLPPARAVIDLYQKNETYPFKDLCGAAIPFKLISAILKIDSFGIKEGWEKWLLDLVAIATIADMVPLLDENRTLVYYGLNVLVKTRRLGLKLLCQNLNLNPKKIVSDDVAFLIAPRLNAASRMDHAATSFYLLITELKSEADWLVKKLENVNNERKKATEEIVKEIKNIYKDGENLSDFIVDGSEEWRPGSLSLAVTRVVEEYDKPACLWGKATEENIKGSCRSNGRIDLVELLNNVEKNIFYDFGGHPMAAGFTVKKEKIKILENALREAFLRTPKKEIEENILMIDGEFFLDDVNWENYGWLEKLEPFGMANPKPIFLFKNLKIKSIRTFGNGGLHLELSFKKSGGETIKAIGFFMSSSLRLSENRNNGLKPGDIIDLCASFDKNYYNGNIELRLKITDFKTEC